MEGLFLEYENENALRSYPFSAGRVSSGNAESLPDGLFIDAALYPVNLAGNLYLSSISKDGLFTVSDSGTGDVVMSGFANGDVVDLHDTSVLSRHSGILVASSANALSELAGRGKSVEYTPEETMFSSGCVFPVPLDGVTSLSIGERELGFAAGDVSFANGPNDEVRVSSAVMDDGRSTLRFDVLPRPSASDDVSIKRIICVVDGMTPFRIGRLGKNTIMLSLHGIDRDMICSSVHPENSIEMADVCKCNGKCDKNVTSEEPVPETYMLEEVFIPPSDPVGEEETESSDNAFYLVTPNVSGYVNPLSITLQDGIVSPKTSSPEVVVKDGSVELADGELIDHITSKGVILQVPGLTGGLI